MSWGDRGLKRTVLRVFGIPFASEKKVIKTGAEHLSSWSGVKGRWSKQLMKCPQSNRAKDLLVLERNKLWIGIELLTGYVSFRGYLLEFAE